MLENYLSNGIVNHNSAKTRSFALMTAVRAYMWAAEGAEGIILCGRQFMNSLEDSSMQEIKAAIRATPWLLPFFEIGEKFIRTMDKRISYSFAGLDRSIDSIKSKARIRLCWVDEAEGVSDAAWTTLIPTLREEDSELWVTWNPKQKGSATDKRFRQTKDARYRIVEMNWRDNPRFPAILERARQRDLVNRPDDYGHIWEGDYGSLVGSILGRWVSRARKDDRIVASLTFDVEGSPLEVAADLGFNDTACWWYFQRLPGGKVNVLRYEGASGLDAQDWIPKVQDNALDLGADGIGRVWLPHDAKAKTFQSKHTTMEQFLEAFGSDHVGLVPISRKHDQITAARNLLGRCAIDETACEEGIDGLNAWEFSYDDKKGTFSPEPVHNWASHPSDAFAYMAQVAQDLPPPAVVVPVRFPVNANGQGRMVTATLDELWKTTPQRQEARY